MQSDLIKFLGKLNNDLNTHFSINNIKTTLNSIEEYLLKFK